MPPPTLLARSVSALLRVLLLLSLICQSTLFALPGSLLAAPSAPQRPLRQESGDFPPADDEPHIATETPVEAWLGTAEPPVEQPLAELVTPALPAYLTLTLDQAALGAGETTLLTVRAYNDGAPPLADLTLTVLLPPGVATAGGEQDVLHWKLPPLTADEPALQQVTLHLAEGKATGDAVTRILATLAQPGQTPVQAETWLALAPGARKAENSLTAAGAVVQNASGELVLLAGAESAAAGVTFRLTELYHWQAAPVEAPTEPTPVVLPVAESLTATETLTVTPHAPPAPASESTMQ